MSEIIHIERTVISGVVKPGFEGTRGNYASADGTPPRLKIQGRDILWIC